MRHQVHNVIALKSLLRQLLSAPGGLFSVHRLHNDLRSQGIPISKDKLHEMWAYLEDAFLIRSLPMHSTSERQRQSNPRKIYPINTSVASAFDRSGKTNLGHLLETSVALELCRRSNEVSYVRTPNGFEVDFLATSPEGSKTLIQVAASLSDPAVLQRELRALQDALLHHPGAAALILTLTSSEALEAASLPDHVEILPAWQWILQPS